MTIIFQIGNVSRSVRKGICVELDSAGSGRPGYTRGCCVGTQRPNSDEHISQAMRCTLFSEFNWLKIPDASGNEETIRATRLKVSINGAVSSLVLACRARIAGDTNGDES